MKAFLLALISARLLANCSTDHIQKVVQIVRKYRGPYYRQSKKTDYVWSCLLLSFGAIICADAARPLDSTIHPTSVIELQKWLRQTKFALRKSDAWLYAPSNDMNGNCTIQCLHCYLLELKVIILEEELRNSGIIYNLINVTGFTDESNYCPPCEAHTLQNSTIFLERLTFFLKRLSSQGL